MVITFKTDVASTTSKPFTGNIMVNNTPSAWKFASTPLLSGELKDNCYAVSLLRSIIATHDHSSI